ncbi:AMP-binding protein [Streptomyces tricolor]|nr:AMP-binding protein [Streptomyces tricolor]
MLAVLRAGATLVPLDDRNPAERLAYILKDADVRMLLGGLPAGPRSRAAPRHRPGDRAGHRPERSLADGGPRRHRLRRLHLGHHGLAQGASRSPTGTWTRSSARSPNSRFLPAERESTPSPRLRRLAVVHPVVPPARAGHHAHRPAPRRRG